MWANFKFQPTMRHSAVSSYHRLPCRIAAYSNVGRQSNRRIAVRF
jgi:hypothetical protein